MVLLPGGFMEPVRCKLRTVPVRHTPKYEAISYVWRKGRGDILCHGRRLKVPWSLVNALIRFRSTKKKRLLWTDAVCINQENTTERGHQVQMMGDVFKNARRVLVWLGRDDEFSAKKTFDFVSACFPLLSLDEARAMIRQSIRQDRELVQHWKSFFQNDWFTRMWIVQEIGLASEATLYCGEASVEWEILARVFHALEAGLYDIVVEHNLFSIGWVTDLWTQDFQGNRFAPESTTICEVLNRNRFQKCSNDWDRIYALLGHQIFQNNLSNPTSTFYLSVDYEVSLAELYTKVCQRVIRLSGSRPLSILALVRHDPTTIKDFCISSWVPQLQSIQMETLLDSEENPRFTAPGQQSIQPAFRDQTLIVRGISFDTVAWTSDVFAQGCIPRDPSNAVEMQNPHPLQQTWYYFEEHRREFNNDILEAICDSLTAGRCERRPLCILNRKDRLGNETFNEDLMADLAAYLYEMGVDTGKMLDMVSFGVPSRFSWVQALNDRRVFVTSRGWVGIGPAVTSVGNEVCVLFGSPTPMVVWELPSAGEKLVRLCGESYVHGIMQGEAVQAMEAGDFEETTFNII